MKKLVVLGGGISGYGSAILARRKGFDVFLSDSGRIADRYRMKLEAWGVPYEEGGHSEERILAASECVKSPGIPDSAPIVRKLRERGVPVISEIEFAGRYLDGARTICITGSNGKTVIKEWIAEELPAGMKCYRSPKSYNSQLGVPLSVLMIEGDEQLALIEAGISKPGELSLIHI